jgi:hypothetical protein
LTFPVSFFLFGPLKNRLQGQKFGSADELLLGVQEILDEISAGTLEVVFGSGSTDWTDALLHCSIKANGKYVE